VRGACVCLLAGADLDMRKRLCYTVVGGEEGMIAKQAKREATKRAHDALLKLDADRVSAGLCRHCGVKTPCGSPFGDIRPGVRNPEGQILVRRLLY
jgi:hypothetical protein